MSNIEHRGIGDQSSEDVIDAEFVEIDERGHAKSPKPKGNHGCVTYAAIGGGIVSMLFLVTMCAAIIALPPDAGNSTAEQTAFVADASSPESVLAQFRGGDAYPDVRQRLADAGFIPVRYSHRDCSPYGTAPGEDCYDRAEIYYCSGTGQGFCSAYWRRGEQFLSVLIAEGPSGSFESANLMSRTDLAAVLAQDGQTFVD